MSNNNLHNAKRAKQDEFYTQWIDIEREMNAYLEYDPDVFRGKTVLLPCDDPGWSNFTKYFAERFEYLGIKKLISTSYAPKANMEGAFYNPDDAVIQAAHYDPALDYERGKIFVLDGTDLNADGRVDKSDFRWDYLQGDGDFRSAEVTALCDEADIVVTNPPFSLFREFMSWLNDGDVLFSVIGSKNAITYKGIFPLIKENKMWTGSRSMSDDFLFRLPKSSQDEVLEGKPGSRYRIVDGEILGSAPAMWFTNIQHGRRHEPLRLMSLKENQKYNKRIIKNPNSYKKYDNYDAIEVPFTSGTPNDYSGVMGVPISFLDKYCPEQFEILGLTTGRSEFDEVSYPTKRYVNAVQHNTNGTTSNGSKVNTRATIVDENPTSTHYTADNQNKPMTIVYARILIRHINSAAQDVQLAQVHTLKTATPEPQQMAA